MKDAVDLILLKIHFDVTDRKNPYCDSNSENKGLDKVEPGLSITVLP